MTFGFQLSLLYRVEVFLLAMLALLRWSLSEAARESKLGRSARILHYATAILAVLTIFPLLGPTPVTDSDRLLLTLKNVPLLAAVVLCVILHVRLIPATPATPYVAELDLTPDRLPKTVWSVAGVPILTAALIYWLAGHWNQLPSIYSPDSDPVWHKSAFHAVRSSLVMWCVFGLWNAVQGIAQWYGSPRTPAHRAQFDFSIAQAWFMPLAMAGVILAIYLKLSWPALALCGLSVMAGTLLMVVFGTRVRKIWKAAGSPIVVSEGWYFDRDDPAMWGPRGTNMGNPWQWALMTGSVLPIGIALFWR